jgi:hypothetical protein
MLITPVDGLWVLQVLANIEVLAPELGLRPYSPRAETARMALDHPVAAELHSVGALTDDGSVEPVLLEWLTVLTRRDLGVLIYAQTPAEGVSFERILLARFAHWWVRLERCGPVVRLSGAGVAPSCSAATGLVTRQIDALCGSMEPAAMRPVTLATAELQAGVTNRSTLHAYLIRQRLDAHQLRTLEAAADDESSAQASVVAIQSGIGARSHRTHIHAEAVTVIDTRLGRLLVEPVAQAGKQWLHIGPGTSGAVDAAVQRLLRRLPAGDEWSSFRKVV